MKKTFKEHLEIVENCLSLIGRIGTDDPAPLERIHRAAEEASESLDWMHRDLYGCSMETSRVEDPRVVIPRRYTGDIKVGCWYATDTDKLVVLSKDVSSTMEPTLMIRSKHGDGVLLEEAFRDAVTSQIFIGEPSQTQQNASRGKICE